MPDPLLADKHRALLEALPDLLFEVDLDGRYYDFHSPRAGLLYRPVDEIIGKTIRDILPGPVAELQMAAIREAAEHGVSISKQYELEVADGILWFEASVAAMPHGTGFDRFSMLVRNISDRRMLERDLFEKSERLQKQISQRDGLFTILAHDLRGPVGNLSTLLRLLNQQEVPPDDAKELLLECSKAAQRTYDLLENVLGWVRGQMEEIGVLMDRIPLLRVLSTVKGWLDSPAGRKGITIVVECPPELTAWADERVLETIVRNLVSNAVKFSFPGSTVLLRARRCLETVALEVVDHGAGVSTDQLARLFLGDKRHVSLGSAGERGNGLGLMFSFDLANSLGARLEAESALGEGSTFRLVIPDPITEEL